MVACNSIETHNIYPNINDQQEIRLNRINKIKDYVAEIKKRELIIKRLSKCIPSFDYFDKSLIVLSVTTGSISIESFVTVIEAPVGIAIASFSLACSISTGIVKKFSKTTQSKKKTHNVILLFKVQKKYRKHKSKSFK